MHSVNVFTALCLSVIHLWHYCWMIALNKFYVLTSTVDTCCCFCCSRYKYVLTVTFTFCQSAIPLLLLRRWLIQLMYSVRQHAVVASSVAALCRVSECTGTQTWCCCGIREGHWTCSKSFLSPRLTVRSASAAWSSWWCSQGAAATTDCHW